MCAAHMRWTLGGSATGAPPPRGRSVSSPAQGRRSLAANRLSLADDGAARCRLATLTGLGEGGVDDEGALHGERGRRDGEGAVVALHRELERPGCGCLLRKADLGDALDTRSALEAPAGLLGVRRPTGATGDGDVQDVLSRGIG